jgi:hypothetical protein
MQALETAIGRSNIDLAMLGAAGHLMAVTRPPPGGLTPALR